ncbi:hypothetical protein [Macrococcoides caseolyticum]|uniref:hypothetical protein n=1 Tax=Macrococcoides caseolyticum TaxID=69966 RepID=UPI001060857F|nr:hypothetical protein [Macrococcus caseolyticus]TDM18849.1 hypothetical protein ETI00_02505 [Macrococcus caseolyticus]VUC69057.1 Uncharacterised protein [Macrococcus caseolyticus]
MEAWSVLTKIIDGEEKIVKAGLNLVIDDDYDRAIIVDESKARQSEKLEVKDGVVSVKNGMILLSLEKLNNKTRLKEIIPVKLKSEIEEESYAGK